MSEKIYACLLRLYPPAFRRRYEEETIQLVRDRLRDEPGFFRRLCLYFDLITDTIRALPQAYRNSYAEVAADRSMAHPLHSAPMFQSLHSEPIRRETFVVAGTLTLMALIAFGYVMGLPVPTPTAKANGSRSPIESVLERLNRQAPQRSIEDAAPQVLHPATTAGPEKRAIPARNTAPPLPGNVPSNVAAQTIEPAKPHPSPRALELESSSNAAAELSRSAAPRRIAQTPVGVIPAETLNAVSSQARVVLAGPEGLSGRWIEYPPAGADAEFPGGLILVQHDAVLSGFGIVNSSDRNPAIHGSVSGNSLRFELSDGRKSFAYDLRLEGEELRGTLIIRSANETRRATVRLQRAP